MPIAFDTSVNGGIVNPGTSRTWSHTCSGNDRLLFVGCFGAVGADQITGVTYNGVAMTLVGKILEGGGSGRYIYLFYLLNPASGANNVVVTASASIVIAGMSTSYTGVKQSGQPDASMTNSAAGVASNTNYTTSVTTVANNCWAVLFTKNNSGTSTAGTGSTQRQSSSNGEALYDSNAALTPAGSKSMSAQVTGLADWGSVMASFAPVPSPTPNLALLGVG